MVSGQCWPIVNQREGQIITEYLAVLVESRIKCETTHISPDILTEKGLTRYAVFTRVKYATNPRNCWTPYPPHYSNGWAKFWSEPMKLLVDKLNHAHWLRISHERHFINLSPSVKIQMDPYRAFCQISKFDKNKRINSGSDSRHF